MKLIEIISVDFKVKDQLQTVYSALVKYLRKKNADRQYIIYLRNSRNPQIHLFVELFIVIFELCTRTKYVNYNMFRRNLE